MQSDSLARYRPRPKPNDWREALRNAFRRPEPLLEFLGLPPDERVPAPGGPFSMLVPEGFARRMRVGDPDDPLLLQVLPDPDEVEPAPGFHDDPVGDRAARAGRGVLHKYHGRALLVTTGACAVHCRYCFRQEFPYASERGAADRWRRALDYIAANPEIDEVILSGGDPLMLSTGRLAELTARLASIEHLHRLRIHTRMPVVLPERVDDGLCEWLAGLPWPVVVVIHANHPAEFDSEVASACRSLRDSGAHLLNQAVLLAGINDDERTLTELMIAGLDCGVLPYYLHLLDRVSGSRRFEVDEARARDLAEALRRRLSGYLVPRLVREVAGKPYKLPIL